jgi:hypothetical protein
VHQGQPHFVGAQLQVGEPRLLRAQHQAVNAGGQHRQQQDGRRQHHQERRPGLGQEGAERLGVARLQALFLEEGDELRPDADDHDHRHGHDADEIDPAPRQDGAGPLARHPEALERRFAGRKTVHAYLSAAVPDRRNESYVPLAAMAYTVKGCARPARDPS